LHAASDFVNARAARVVGDAFGIPLVYEVRGFWEETMISSLSRKFSWQDDHKQRHGLPDTYRWRQQSEEQEWRSADAVVTLAPVMADKIAAAGVPRERITIAANAIDPDEFTPMPRDLALVRDLGFREDTTIIGYVSSLTEYEGIDVLIRAFARLRANARSGGLGLLIVGSGQHQQALEAVAGEVGAEGVVFTGRVPHDQVTKYYGVMDVFVVPRLPVTVCRLVTPLKPYEAFALERAVVMSDVEALAGIAEESGSAKLARAGDDRDLARVIGRLIDDDEGRVAMARRAREWVIAERTWDRNAEIYAGVYRRVTEPSGQGEPAA
jgi:glycosyltransferase involved in cell wall biosynthesis